MNIIEYAFLVGLSLAGFSVFVGGLPVVRRKLDTFQTWDEDAESDYADETSETESVRAI